MSGEELAKLAELRGSVRPIHDIRAPFLANLRADDRPICGHLQQLQAPGAGGRECFVASSGGISAQSLFCCSGTCEKTPLEMSAKVLHYIFQAHSDLAPYPNCSHARYISRMWHSNLSGVDRYEFSMHTSPTR